MPSVHLQWPLHQVFMISHPVVWLFQSSSSLGRSWQRKPPINNGSLLARVMFVLTPSRGEGAGVGRVATLQRGCPWLQPQLPGLTKSQGCLEQLSRMAGGCSQVLSQSIRAGLSREHHGKHQKELQGLCSTQQCLLRFEGQQGPHTDNFSHEMLNSEPEAFLLRNA